jgi:hypothetical protein
VLTCAFFVADSYAEYATWKYFEALFGTPDALIVPREEQEEDEKDNGESAPADTPVKPSSGRGLNVVLFTQVSVQVSQYVGLRMDVEARWHFFTTNVSHGIDCAYGSVSPAPRGGFPSSACLKNLFYFAYTSSVLSKYATSSRNQYKDSN